MTRAEKTIVELEKQGWTFDRKATVKGYYTAGHISTMETRKGYDYIRVYDGSSKNIKRGGYWFRIQITYVMKRKAN